MSIFLFRSYYKSFQFALFKSKTFSPSEFDFSDTLSRRLKKISKEKQKHVENDGFIESTQRKKVGFESNLAEMLYDASPISGKLLRAYSCLFTPIRTVKFSKTDQQSLSCIFL